MKRKFLLEDKEYDLDELTDAGKTHAVALKFVDERLNELVNHRAVLQRAKNSYADSLKSEMLSDKAGFLFGDN